LFSLLIQVRQERFGNDVMQRYFFDLRDGDELVVDEEGMLLRDIAAAEEEAARSLADMAKEDVEAKFNGLRGGLHSDGLSFSRA
jgi:hypothetical protein